MKTKAHKHDWLLGRWEIESDDTSAVFYITRQSGRAGKVVVQAFDKHDGENFRVIGTHWHGDALAFETLVPSTRYRARHILRPVSKSRLRQEITLFENWKRTGGVLLHARPIPKSTIAKR